MPDTTENRRRLIEAATAVLNEEGVTDLAITRLLPDGGKLFIDLIHRTAPASMNHESHLASLRSPMTTLPLV